MNGDILWILNVIIVNIALILKKKSAMEMLQIAFAGNVPGILKSV